MSQSDNTTDLDKELNKGLHELEQQLEFYRRRGYENHAEQLSSVLQRLRNSKNNATREDKLA